MSEPLEAEAEYSPKYDTFRIRVHNGRVNLMQLPMRVGLFETLMRGMIRAWERSGRKL